MIVAGLTGSIGMGKSTTAQMFRDAGIPVYDADAAVHDLYSGDAVPVIENAFPGVTKDGIVDRAKLGQMVIGNSEAMKKLESLIHPLVHKIENEFREQAKKNGAFMVVLDIPLLFETGGYNRVDTVIVVSASPEQQRDRVLAREGMTKEKFEAILAKQVPDEEKRQRADFVIDTGQGLEHARSQVLAIISKLKNQSADE